MSPLVPDAGTSRAPDSTSSAQVQALRRAALAVSHPGGPQIFEALVLELAASLQVAIVFVAVFAPEDPSIMRTLAVCLDGKPLRNFDYQLKGTPCEAVVGRACKYIASGASSQLLPDSLFARQQMDSFAAFPLNDSTGQPLGLLAAMHRTPIADGDADHAEAMLKIIAGRVSAAVTQKKALDELRVREQQYRAIFESSSDGLFLWDENLRVVDVNPAGLALYGYRREDVVGRDYPANLPQAYVQQRLELVRRAIAGETMHFESTAMRPDGTSFDAELRVLPFVQQGQPRVLAVVRDISERRARERELQRSEARLRATVEASFDCVIGMDGEGSIVEFNAAAERVFGHRREDVLGRTLAEVILPQRHRDAHSRGVRNFMATGRGPMVGRLVETTALRADGAEFPVELAISVAPVPEGKIFVGHLRDITARKAAEAQRAALESQLRQAQKMEAIGQLTGGLAHDFNNILTSVIGYLAMAQEQPAAEADAALTRQLGQARLAAERARDHVAQLLAFSRPQRGERRLVEAQGLARAALQLLQPTLPAAVAVEWTAGAAQELPHVVGDAVQLEQALFNLCINARDAIGGQGTIRLRVGHCESAGHCASCSAPIGAGGWVWFEVADTGRGIAPETLARMFEPFFTTKEGAGGTGLGLAMVHGIVHDHGGHIEVSSQTGAGSVFRLLLPAAQRKTEDIAAFSKTGTRLRPLLRGRVLLVEDEAMVSDYVTELLTGFGFEVVREHDPLSAAAKLADPREAFDLLLTDQTMPGMTGTALACHSATHRPGLPVVLYTGNASEITQDELDRCAVRALIRKPFDAVALRSLLAGLVRARP
jgi:PAS domain S-box-containing protein